MSDSLVIHGAELELCCYLKCNKCGEAAMYTVDDNKTDVNALTLPDIDDPFTRMDYLATYKLKGISRIHFYAGPLAKPEWNSRYVDVVCEDEIDTYIISDADKSIKQIVQDAGQVLITGL